MALCRGHMECGLGHLTPVPPERLLYNSRSNWPEDVLFTFAIFGTRDFVRFGKHGGRSVADLVWQANRKVMVILFGWRDLL